MGTKTIPQAFGEVLRDCRTKAGISQENLAFKVDLDRTYISLLERGLRQPTLENAFSACGCFGNSASDTGCADSIQER
jgi:transcriptional regulator with XRE-family HTH domain